MIDVPVLVKDALRDGRRLKKYRFLCSSPSVVHTDPVVSTITSGSPTGTFPQTRQYVFVSSESVRAFDDITITNGSDIYVETVPMAPGGATTMRFFVYGIQGATFTLSGMRTDTVNMAIPQDETQYTYDFTIDNDTLVYESVKIDERMASGNELKFGLCEGSSLEFQYFDHPKINGYRIQAFVDVQYEDTDKSLKWHTIPMGYYTVQKCSRQASTGIIKVTAYNKLKSEYLDSEIGDRLDYIQGDLYDNTKISVSTLLDSLLNGYKIEPKLDENNLQTVTALRDRTATAYQIGYTRKIQWSDDVNRTYVMWGFDAFSVTLDPDKRYYLDLGQYAQWMNEEVEQLFKDIRRHCVDAETIISELKTSAVMPGIFGILARYRGTPDNPGVKHKYFCPPQAGTVSSSPTIFVDAQGTQDIIYITNVNSMTFNYPLYMKKTESTTEDTGYPQVPMYEAIHTIPDGYLKVYEVVNDDVDAIAIPKSDISQNTTIRDLSTAIYELKAQYGKLDRQTDLFSGVELNNSALYPAETLYPDDALYPGGIRESSFKSLYSKLWTDEGDGRSFRYLNITYKGLDENNQTKDFSLQVVVNADGTTDYDMTDNWLFKNLTWTADQVTEYASAMAAKMKALRWFPFEMWCAGLPYVETGDMMEIIVGQTTHTSYVLSRTLSGIHNLQDTYINGVLDVF